MSNNILKKILEFSFGCLPTEDFESWLYQAKETEETIGNEYYINLISINYFDIAQCLKAKIYASKIIFILDHELWSTFFRNITEELINSIGTEFHGILRGSGITLHQAAVLDNRGSTHDFEIASRLDLDCHWDEIPQETVMAHPFILPFLDDIGFAYYIPAYINCILFQIKNKMKCNEWLCWNVYCALDIESNQARNRFEMFSYGQKKAISKFLMLLTLSNDEACCPEDCKKALLSYWINIT